MKQVDKCDEELIPPLIALTIDPSATFPSQKEEEEEAWLIQIHHQF
jgi:hypothetical protein